ncbi:3'-5' exonuclease [Psychroflexus maritimus]|uniref:3'-5' exonuclease n=1 Tax=Psychroflexus maritimus TaxID=2714865 RepID=A0A967ADU1_9FLAO|nr:3'-5' exonuclease [Psychroflexus maritimus]NGZ90437.1 3'-5' exonuclease [Psychroflexus maritimus]
MLEKINLEHILFLDIETVPEAENYTDLSPLKQQLFADKTAYQRKEDFTPEEFYERAGIWAEFGKIVCISVGYFRLNGTERQLRLKTFHGEEKDLLIEFKQLLESHFYHPYHLLCAHNGKEFDFPYIARRMIILGIALPNKLQLFGKKPWEIPHLDTLEMWKFGDYKHYTSLKLLTEILHVPSPKDDIDGSEVAKVFYQEKNIDRIITYCEKDVVAIAQIFLRYRQEELLEEDEIKVVG